MASGGTWVRVRCSQVSDGRGPVPGGDKDQGRLPGQAGQHRHRVGEGLHRQFMGAVDEFPDEALDDSGLQVQALLQVKGGDVLVAQVVAAVVALPGQVQEGGHDVGHHPVNIEGQGVQGDGVGPRIWRTNFL